MTSPDPLPRASETVTATRWVAVASLLGLILVGLAMDLWLAPKLWAIKVLPLCLPIPGFLRNRMYTYRWVSLFVWLYFLEGVWRSHEAGASGWLALVQILFCLTLFAACVVHVRTRLSKAKHERTDQ